MGPTPNLPLLELLLPAIVLLIAAAVLIWCGVRGTRRGGELHCRNCDYSLVGIHSDRCPECGAELRRAGAAVRGRRVRRPVLAWGGGALGLAGLALVYGAVNPLVRNYDWYRLLPASSLVDRLVGASKPVSDRAWAELKRRSASDSLPAKQRERIAEFALRNQAAGAGGELVDWLGQAVLDGKVSDAQKERFFQQAVKLDLLARPTVVLGDPVPYKIVEQGRGPVASAGWWYEIQFQEVRLDGAIVAGGGGSSSGSGFGSGGSSSSSIPCKVPGQHTISVTVGVKIFHGGTNLDEHDPAARLLHQRHVTLTAPTEVLAAAPPGGAVKLIEDPALGPLLKATVLLSDLKWEPATRTLSGRIELRSGPTTDVAFEVLARVGQKESRVGSITCRNVPGRYGFHFSQPDLDLDVGAVGRVDLVFRSSEEVARRTVDFFEIWKGGLDFPDQPVKTKPPPR